MTSELRAKAEAELKKYPNSLIELLGPSYESHPRFKAAVEELAANRKRGALAILTDIREARPHTNAK
jgi:FMN phosphatase YigB (HAD superfamily)